MLDTTPQFLLSFENLQDYLIEIEWKVTVAELPKETWSVKERIESVLESVVFSGQDGTVIIEVRKIIDTYQSLDWLMQASRMQYFTYLSVSSRSIKKSQKHSIISEAQVEALEWKMESIRDKIIAKFPVEDVVPFINVLEKSA